VTKVDDVARAAIARAERSERPTEGERGERGKKRDRERAQPTAETREFWETWAEEKSTRPAEEPAPAPTEAASDEEPERKRGRGDRDRKRGARDRDSRETKQERARGKRDTVAEQRPARTEEAGDAQARLFISLGKKHGVSAEDLRALLAAPIGGDTSRIGSVSLRDSHAHVRVPEELVDTIIAGVHGTVHNEHAVTVERSRT
jgi:hypothetical protein